MSPTACLVAYCGAVAAASLAGGWLPTRVRLTHTRMQIMMSFVAGLMLGVALLHMLPHAAVEFGSLDRAVVWTLAGLLGMFFLIRTFHFHQHGSEEELDEDLSAGEEPAGDRVAGHDHSHVGHEPHAHESHACGHHHGHQHHGHGSSAEPSPAELLRSGSPYAWTGLALGLGVHTLLDGLALGASVAAESHVGGGWLFGVGTFLAVVLHKPLDAMSITTLMRAAGWSVQRQQLVNVVFALLCPAGAMGFWLGLSHFVQSHQFLLGVALAFSAGAFLCISLGDLLPEVHFHDHDRGKLSAALVIGVALAYGVGLLEPAHVHQSPAHDHEHSHER